MNETILNNLTSSNLCRQRQQSLIAGRSAPWKIAIVTSFPANPEKPHGGVEAVSVNLVSALAKFRDLEINVVTTDRACQTLSRSKWNHAFIHRLPWQGNRVLTHVLGHDKVTLTRYLNWLSPDLIHAHDFYGIMVRDIPIPRVFTIHGFIHADTLHSRKKHCRLRSLIWRKVECDSWAHHPHIIAISPYVRERLHGIATGTIHDIDNPISEECFRIRRTEHSNIIFSAALLEPRKNTLGLLEAFYRMRQKGFSAKLRLAGSSADDKYDRQIRTFISEHHLADEVILLGRINAEQVRRELSQAGVFALVSFEEGAPMGVAEAMAAGLPIVTSNRCGMPYMVRDGESGFLVDPNNVGEIAQAIMTILQNDKLRMQMGRRARQTALERFHPQSVAAKTRQVYFKAMNIGHDSF